MAIEYWLISLGLCCIFRTTSTVLSKVKPSYICQIKVSSDLRHTFKGILAHARRSQAVVHQQLGVPAKQVFLIFNYITYFGLTGEFFSGTFWFHSNKSGGEHIGTEIIKHVFKFDKGK